MRKIVTIILALFITSAAYSQSADVVTEILNSSQVTYGQVCYLSAVQQGMISDSSSYDDAINALYAAEQIPEIVESSTPIVMANLTFIYAQMWNVKGGLMYRLTKGSPRYSYKQFKADGIIAENSDPAKIVSGSEALSMYTSCAITYGGQSLSTSEE